MKKFLLLFTVGMMCAAMAACGSEAADSKPVEASVSEEGSQSSSESKSEEPASKPEETPETTQSSEEASEPAKEESAASTEETSEEKYRVGNIDNFSVSSEMAAAFGEEVKEIIAAKDLEALADLTAFPLYIGFADGGVSVETKEDFIALGADKIFTQEFVNEMSLADTGNLSASKAGFSLTKSGKPNVIFGVANGRLAIKGMNY